MKDYLFIYRNAANVEIARAVYSFPSLTDARAFGLLSLIECQEYAGCSVFISVSRGFIASFLLD